MFKKFKNLLLLFAYTIILTGCMQYDLSMKINDDKSMDFVLIETVEQSLLNEDGTLKNEGFGTDSLPSTIIDFEELKKIFIQKGYTVESYTDPDKPTHQGAKIFKHFEDIDKISKEGEKVEIDFTAITDEIFDDSYFFTVQKGLVYNIYKGSFKIMNEDNLLDPSYSSYLNIKYTLKLPKNSFVESNATTVSDDKTVLTWELDGSKVNNINFTFKMAKKSASSGEKNPFKDIRDRAGIPIGHDWVTKSTPEGVHNNPYKDIKRDAYNRLVHYPSKPGSKEAKGTPGIYPSVNDVNPESIRKKG